MPSRTATRRTNGGDAQLPDLTGLPPQHGQPDAPEAEPADDAPAADEAQQAEGSVGDQQAEALAAVTKLFEPPEAIDRDADDPDADGIEYVKSGIIRVWVAGTRYRLRRPFFGELRTLREAHQDLRDENDERTEDVRDLAKAINAEAGAIANDDPDRRAKLRELKKRDRAAARELIGFREQGQLDWWAQAFDALSLDGTPGQWPAWAIDEVLPIRVLNHWRTVPLGPGTSRNGQA